MTTDQLTLKALRRRKEQLDNIRDDSNQIILREQAKKAEAVAAIVKINGIIAGTITGDDAIKAMSEIGDVRR